MLMELMVWANRGTRGAIAALGAALAASCGGSTEPIEPFVPQQVIVLGDETNLLTVDGKRYGVNGLDTNGAFDCRLLPVWTQMVAGAWGYVFDQCNPDGLASTRGVMRAAFNAKAADLDAQIDAQLAAAAPTSKDLYTVLVGMHDIIELYEQYPGPKECDSDTGQNPPLEQEVRSRGTHVAQQINRLIELGARVIVSTVPDLGLSPYGLAREAASPGQSALITCLTAAFNARVRVDIIQDGRYVGLVLTDDLIPLMAEKPANYGLANVTDAACTTAVPDCTTQTLVAGANATNYLWADDRRLGPVAHSQLYQLAVTRAQRNPF
jgi:outer membrane lipase/esterase